MAEWAGGGRVLPSGMDSQRTSIAGIQRMLDSDELTAAALTVHCLKRIADADTALNAVLCTSTTAPDEAAASDLRRREGKSLGPLDGIPVLVKDNIDTADLPTTAGSRALRGAPAADAELVRRLRAGGAVVLGKANLSEWGNFRSVSSVSGWSGVGGQTHNAYARDRNPGGSSSGSAVGVAMGFAQIAVGTETSGSIISPAALNGVVGVRPTLGRVSGRGVVPISADQDTAGPLARSVADAALLLSALSDPRDDEPAHPGPRPGDPSPLAGARLGLCRVPAFGPEVDGITDGAVAVLRAAGAEVVPVGPFHDLWLAEHLPDVLLAEFRRDIARYFQERPGAPGSLAEVVAHNRTDPAETACFAGQELLEAAVRLSDDDAERHLALRGEASLRSRRALETALAADRLDALVAPSAPLPWPMEEEPVASKVAWSPGASAGWPEVTVPAGAVDGFPVGISFLGPAWSEQRLLGLAACYERSADARTVPPAALETVR